MVRRARHGEDPQDRGGAHHRWRERRGGDRAVLLRQVLSWTEEDIAEAKAVVYGDA